MFDGVVSSTEHFSRCHPPYTNLAESCTRTQVHSTWVLEMQLGCTITGSGTERSCKELFQEADKQERESANEVKRRQVERNSGKKKLLIDS